MINILLAEDHNVVRGGLKSLLEKEDEFVIAGEAGNGAEALRLLTESVQADIVLTDMNMPVMGGIELVAQVKKQFPAVKVIILSAHDQEKYVIKAFKTGANGYLLKSVSRDELIFAIKHTSQYNQYICSELMVKFLNRMLTMPDPVNHENNPEIVFSGRDKEILGMIAEGFTNQEIADKMFTSKRTIENHRQGLIDKTGSRNTVALIRYAILNGVI